LYDCPHFDGAAQESNFSTRKIPRQSGSSLTTAHKTIGAD
jgi:hypothetical protein